MAIANSIGVRTSADHPARIAAGSKPAAMPRPALAVVADSDPIMDEALRRVRDHRDALREGLAAARAYAASAAA